MQTFETMISEYLEYCREMQAEADKIGETIIDLIYGEIYEPINEKL